MGCIRPYESKTKGTVWRGKFHTADGRQKMVTLGNTLDGMTREQAQAKLNEVERITRDAPLFRDYAVWWLDKGPRCEKVKLATLKDYRRIMHRAIKVLGKVRLSELTQEHLFDYAAGRKRAGAAEKTLNKEMVVLRALCDDAATDFGLAWKLPDSLIHAGRVRAEVRTERLNAQAEVERKATRRIKRVGGSLADSYSLLRSTSDTLGRAVESLSGKERRQAEAVFAALYEAEDTLGRLLKLGA